MSLGAGFKKIFFASALAIFIWIYVDQMAGFDRFMRFHLSNHESMSVEEKSWWFSPYDDYIELQQIQLDAINIAKHQHQIINLTNYFTMAIPFHALLKMYVFQHQWSQARGLAERMCELDPTGWRKIVAIHQIGRAHV